MSQGGQFSMSLDLFVSERLFCLRKNHVQGSWSGPGYFGANARMI